MHNAQHRFSCLARGSGARQPTRPENPPAFASCFPECPVHRCRDACEPQPRQNLHAASLTATREAGGRTARPDRSSYVERVCRHDHERHCQARALVSTIPQYAGQPVRQVPARNDSPPSRSHASATPASRSVLQSLSLSRLDNERATGTTRETSLMYSGCYAAPSECRPTYLSLRSLR